MLSAIDQFKQRHGAFRFIIEDIQSTRIGRKIDCRIRILKEPLIQLFITMTETLPDSYIKEELLKYSHFLYIATEEIYKIIDKESGYQEILTEMLECDEYDFDEIGYEITEYIKTKLYLVEDILDNVYLNTIYLILNISRANRFLEMKNNNTRSVELNYGCAAYLLNI